MTIKYVEPAVYDALVARLERRRLLTDQLLNKMRTASLAEKIAIKAEIKALSAEIYAKD